MMALPKPLFRAANSEQKPRTHWEHLTQKQRMGPRKLSHHVVAGLEPAAAFLHASMQQEQWELEVVVGYWA